jgi:phosphatidylglycerol:prolipoprotein diacylglycerol transferase
MYPTFYHLFYDAFGVKLAGLKFINSFGFFMALSYAVAYYIFVRELKRKEEEKLILAVEKPPAKPDKNAALISLIVYGLIGFIVGYKMGYLLLNYAESVADTQAFLMSGKGNIIFGLLAGGGFGYLKYRENQKLEAERDKDKPIVVHPYNHSGNITMIAAVGGLLGAKLFAYLENPVPLSEFFADPFSGLTIFGGLICGIGLGLYYLYKNKLSIPHFIDSVAPGLIMAYGVGRIGCQISGDGDWGINNAAAKPGWMNFLPDWMWAYNYPNNVNQVGVPIENCRFEETGHCFELATPVYPTPMYEALMCLLIFGILWYFRKKITIPGVLFSLYMILSGIERFFIEKIRVNDTYDMLGMKITQAEIIAVSFVLIGVAGIYYFKKQHEKKEPPADIPDTA